MTTGLVLFSGDVFQHHLASQYCKKDIHPVPELWGRGNGSWTKCTMKALPLESSIFFHRAFFCFPFKNNNNKVLLLHNYGTRDQTVLKMQKVPYIPTAVAQKKHPLQDLNKPFNSYLPLIMKITKSTMPLSVISQDIM